MARILVVEDERDLNDLIARQLRQEGHDAAQAYDGEAALAAVEATRPELVILDWMLPKLDGLTVARRIRERHIVPILMLTARGEETDIIVGLEVGADDYLTKPFRMRELMARTRAILRRYALAQAAAAPDPAGTDTIHAGAIALSLPARSVSVDGAEIQLTPKEFDLLTLFVQNPGRAFSRDYLLERIWADDYDLTDRTVDTHIQRLRKKLGGEADAIRTVWGIGYKFQPTG